MNLVKKHDHNRGGYHKDLKNDYDRQEVRKDIESQLEQTLSEVTKDEQEPESDQATLYENFVSGCLEISIKEYERAREHSFITSFN